MQSSRRAWRAGLVVAAAIALAGGALVVAGQSAARPFVGITYLERSESTPRPVHIRVVDVDLAAPGIRVVLSPPAGTREVVRQTTRGFLAAVGAQVAVNAHFFSPFPSPDTDVEVIGLAAADGRVFSGFESPRQSYALVADAPAINIGPDNRATVVHRDPARADGRGVRESVTLWTAVAGSAQIVTDGVVTIPAYRDDEHPDGALTPGGPGQYSNAKSWYEVITARTAIGISKDGRVLTIFTVDARGGSAGLTVGEVAARLVRDHAVWNALNLDGGGSTSLAMTDAAGTARLINVPSDGTGDGRAVATVLAVFATAVR